MEVSRFDKEFRKLYLPLCMFALRIMEDRDAAADIVQDTFAAVWSGFEDTDAPANFKAYMYMAVRNRCVSRIRSESATIPINESGVTEMSEEDIDTSERDARLWKALDSLPEKCRRVFLLSKRDGLSNAEVAEELNISVKTVENQMTKAYSRLRKSLGARRHGSDLMSLIMFF